MFVRCSLFLALLLLGRVQCQTTAEPGECGVWLYVGVSHITVNSSSHSGTAVSSSEYQTLIEKFRSLENHVTNLVQLIGSCTFVQEFRSQLTQVRDRLTNLEAAAERNKEELKQKTDASFTAVQDTLGDLKAEQQKVGEGLETLRSETAQLTLTVGRNITLPPQYLPASCSEIAKRDPSSPPGYYQLSAPDGTITTDYCFAHNCSDIATSHPSSPPGYYQLSAPDGSITTDYCFAPNCSGIATSHPSSPPGYYQLRATNGTTTTEYCFASSCADQAEKDPSSPSGYYQLRATNGTTTTEYCFASSCADQAEKDPSSPPGYYQLMAPNGTITTEYCFAHNCSDIATSHPSSPPGYYQLMAPNGTITTEYCPMECKKCLAIKSTGGWRRVAYLNMTDPTHQCPSGFRLFTEPRRCSPGTNDSFKGCASVTYPMHGIQYQRVCGRVIGYQKGATLAFIGVSQLIDSNYVDGVSLTLGGPPNRHHIWTFAAAVDEQHARYRCPCSNTSKNFTERMPNYVGDDYFCDSGTRVWIENGYDELYTEDPLWDGSGCGPTSSCCTFNSPPWFCKELPQPTTDDIELRACRIHYYSYGDTQIKQIELYIQ